MLSLKPKVVLVFFHLGPWLLLVEIFKPGKIKLTSQVQLGRCSVPSVGTELVECLNGPVRI